jgi:predicted NBD/HSP70 family sugar kinase
MGMAAETPPGPPRHRANASDIRVLDTLLASGRDDLTLTALAELAGVSRRSMTTVAAKLGPPRVLERETASFGPGAGLMVAVGVGTENIRAALVDANGDLHCKDEAAPDRGQLSEPPVYILRRLRTLVLSVLENALDNKALIDSKGSLSLVGLAVAWPGPIQRDGYARTVIFEDPEWQTVPLAQRVSASLGGPFGNAALVDCINGANAAVASIAFDRPRRVEDRQRPHSETIMAVRIGGVVGAGTMRVPRWAVDGTHPFLSSQLFVGTNGHAGELGHFPIAESAVRSVNAQRPHRLAPLASRDCSCGKRGHLEGFIGAGAVADRLAHSGYRIDLTRSLGPQLDPLLDTPDEVVGRALHDVGRLLGKALASPVLMLDPASITLTGYFARREVISGIRGEQALLSSGFATGVDVGELPGGPSPFVEVRGAALLRLRRLVYRDLVCLTDETRRQRLLTEFGRHELAAMAAVDL